jgi:REP element-mobilizing transposase RayT
MARPYRIQAENCLYHITSRGDDRKKIFISETDYQKFLEYIELAKEKFKFYMYAYCLMGNHYHFLLETTQANISRVMQYINTAYTVYYNLKRKRCGHLFQGRYKSILVEADVYLMELTRYIHLNPVRAKIVDSPEKYRWSSYREYIKGNRKGIIDKIQIDRYFKLVSKDYKKFVYEGMEKDNNPFVQIYAGFILGKEKFIKNTLNIMRAQKDKGEDFSYKKIVNSLEPGDVIQEVARYYQKEEEELRNARKKSLLARKIAIYLLKRLTALTNKEIGSEFGISYSGVSWISRDVGRLIEKNKKIKKDVEIAISHLKV